MASRGLHHMIITVSLVAALFIPAALYSQESGDGEYLQAYARKDYKSALEMIQRRLGEIYDSRVQDRRIPVDFITSKKLEEKLDLNALYKKRMLTGFFLEDNQELHTLHLHAARCHAQLEDFNASLNHYNQCMRYKGFEPGKDDIIFYEMSQVCLRMNRRPQYLRMLEAAYAMNPSAYEYSRELGAALTWSNQKKKAIFHLERYLQSAGGKEADPALLLVIANLNEDIGRYLETVRYYGRYLEARKEDGGVWFALGFLAFRRTGDFNLALRCFEQALSLLPENETYRRSKAHEYRAAIEMKELQFEKAVASYLQTIRYQERLRVEIERSDKEIARLRGEIGAVKTSLLKERDFDKYNEYEMLMDEKGRQDLERRERVFAYGKLNSGEVRWNIAQCYERLERLDEAMRYYREAISFNHNASRARERIIKLQLKINRGY